MTRRDLTNQFGAFVPTETAAIRNADRRPEPPVSVPRSPSVLRVKATQPQPQKTPDEIVLKRARQLFSIIGNIMALEDFRIVTLELRAKGDPKRYYYGDGMKSLEAKDK